MSGGTVPGVSSQCSGVETWVIHPLWQPSKWHQPSKPPNQNPARLRQTNQPATSIMHTMVAWTKSSYLDCLFSPRFPDSHDQFWVGPSNCNWANMFPWHGRPLWMHQSREGRLQGRAPRLSECSSATRLLDKRTDCEKNLAQCPIIALSVPFQTKISATVEYGPFRDLCLLEGHTYGHDNIAVVLNLISHKIRLHRPNVLQQFPMTLDWIGTKPDFCHLLPL